MPLFTDKQAAYAPPCPPLTGRHKAPTGAPASTKVRVGGEGTPSAPAACAAPGDIATATLPDGTRKQFRELPCFDAYVGVWRAAGFLVTWNDPWTVVITRGGLDAGPPRPSESPAHPDTP